MTHRVWDTFVFCDELDLLEARLTELDDAVYRFVLVEAPVTYQGAPKPLHYQENRERFAPWKDRIVHVVADLKGCDDPWARESAQREAIPQGLGEFRDEDIFLLSDVDEIPRPDVLQKAPGHVLVMRSHVLAVNLIEPGWWSGTMATTGKPPEVMQAFRARHKSPSQDALRDVIGWPLIAGWHFTWLGGPDAIRAKVPKVMHSFGHHQQAAMIDTHAERMYQERISPASGGQCLIEAVIDTSWPKYMQEHRGPASWYWPGE